MTTRDCFFFFLRHSGRHLVHLSGHRVWHPLCDSEPAGTWVECGQHSPTLWVQLCSLHLYAHVLPSCASAESHHSLTFPRLSAVMLGFWLFLSLIFTNFVLSCPNHSNSFFHHGNWFFFLKIWDFEWSFQQFHSMTNATYFIVFILCICQINEIESLFNTVITKEQCCFHLCFFFGSIQYYPP